MDEAGDDEGSKEGREGAPLADAFFHEEGAPGAIIPFVVDGAGVLVEKCGEREDFWEGSGDDVEKFFAGDTVELVGEVEEDGSTGWEGIGLLGAVDELFDGELHRFNDKVAAIRDADGIVEGEEVGGELVSEGVGDVAGDETADGGRNPEGTKFGGVGGVFVKTK